MHILSVFSVYRDQANTALGRLLENGYYQK